MSKKIIYIGYNVIEVKVFEGSIWSERNSSSSSSSSSSTY